jgi:hypothetical protein
MVDLDQAVSGDFQTHPAWQRLEEQLRWYGNNSRQNQRWYKVLQITQLVLAALIPVAALAGGRWGQWIAALFGAIIAVAGGIQHLFQFSANWISYRSTAEHLKHEKYLFLSRAGPYRDLSPQEALPVLAERVEEHVSVEHARWVQAVQRQMPQGKETTQ